MYPGAFPRGAAPLSVHVSHAKIPFTKAADKRRTVGEGALVPSLLMVEKEGNTCAEGLKRACAMAVLRVPALDAHAVLRLYGMFRFNVIVVDVVFDVV